MTDLTSAKSRLIKPGVVIRSVIPDTGEKHLVSGTEGVKDRDVAIADGQQPVVGNDDQGVDFVAQGVDSGFSRTCTATAFEREGAGDDTDGQGAKRAGDACNDGRTACTGTTTLTGGDKHHVGAAEHFLDLIGMVFGGLLADLGVGAGAESW